MIFQENHLLADDSHEIPHIIFSKIRKDVTKFVPGCVMQSVTCLTTDACLTADPGVASSITTLSHTFAEIDREIISTVILFPSADSFKKGCCQLEMLSRFGS